MTRCMEDQAPPMARVGVVTDPYVRHGCPVARARGSCIQGTGEVLPVEDDPVAGSGRSRCQACKACKGKHGISPCSVFPTKSLNWRRRFARSNARCYRCLSTSHVRKRCPEKNGCMEKDCAYPLKSPFSVTCTCGDTTLSQGN